MTRVVWDQAKDRTFESGLDRGMLYPNVHNSGVPWNGLISVNETPVGGTSEPYYIDGYKYHNYQSSEEFSASITAFTYPEQFQTAVGFRNVDQDLSGIGKYGFLVDNQPRTMFGMSYRTMKGDGVKGQNAGYLIHLIYNAMAEPIGKTHETWNAIPSASDLSWSITTIPVVVSGRRHSAHFVIDSTKTNKFLMNHMESILYGGRNTPPRLPNINELINEYYTYEPSGYGFGPYGHGTYGHGHEL